MLDWEAYSSSKPREAKAPQIHDNQIVLNKSRVQIFFFLIENLVPILYDQTGFEAIQQNAIKYGKQLVTCHSVQFLFLSTHAMAPMVSDSWRNNGRKKGNDQEQRKIEKANANPGICPQLYRLS